MKIKSPKTRKKKLLLTGCVIAGLVLLGVAAAYAFYGLSGRSTDETRGINDIDYSEPTDEDKKRAADKKDAVIENNEARENTVQDSSDSFSVTINRFNQAPDGVINVRSVVNGLNDGSCKAVFSQNTTSFERMFLVSNELNYPACNLDLPASDFPSSGIWTLTLSVVSDSVSSKPATAELNISR